MPPAARGGPHAASDAVNEEAPRFSGSCPFCMRPDQFFREGHELERRPALGLQPPAQVPSPNAFVFSVEGTPDPPAPA